MVPSSASASGLVTEMWGSALHQGFWLAGGGQMHTPLGEKGVYIESRRPITLAIAIQTPILPRRLLVFPHFLLHMYLVAPPHYMDVHYLPRVPLYTHCRPGIIDQYWNNPNPSI